MNKLTNIIKEELQRLLNEGRLEDVIAKYPEYEKQAQRLAARDPSGNLKYLAWEMTQVIDMVNSGKSLFGIETTIATIIDRFHQLAQRNGISQKDINAYQDFEALKAAVEESEKVDSKRAMKKMMKSGGAQVVYEDDDWFIVIPKTEEAACF